MIFDKIKKYIIEIEKPISILVAIIAIIVSMISLYNSIEATKYAKKAYKLSEQENTEERLLVLDGLFHTSEKKFTLTPIVKNISLQLCEIYYPSELGGQSFKARPPKFEIFTISQEIELAKFIRNKYKDVIDDDEFIALIEGSLPVIIKSYYIAKGNGYTEQSLYALKYQSITGKNHVETKSSFVDLVFIRRLSMDADIQKVLASEWNYCNKNR